MPEPHDYVLTIVAGPAETPGSDPSRADAFIDALIKQFDQKKISYKRAATVVDLAVRLDEAWNDGARAGRKIALQIIGHGSSGQLFLGMPWLEDSNDGYAFPFYVLDSSPESLGQFFTHHAHLASITLAACAIGSPTFSSFSTNGRSLTYTLCESFGCPVVAALHEIAPEQLDGEGLYDRTDPERWARWIWNGPAAPSWQVSAPAVAPVAAATPATSFTIKHVERALIPDLKNRLEAINERVGRKQPQLRAVPSTDPRLRFASKFARVLVSDADGNRHEADLLAGGHVLAIGDARFTIADTDGVSATFRARPRRATS